MRGPYDTPKRSHVIKTRLDDDEYEFFLRKCQVYGMNQSEMIRTSLEKLQIYPVIKFSPVNKELLSKVDELITEGKRIGNNLNQIARALNSDSFDPGIITDIRRALGDLAEWKYTILQEVGSAVGNDQTFELEKLGPRGRRALLDLSARREQQQADPFSTTRATTSRSWMLTVISFPERITASIPFSAVTKILPLPA